MTVYSDYSAVASATTYFYDAKASGIRVFLFAPPTVFAARVNMASITYPLDTLTFDGVTTGAYTDIAVGMTLLLGSSAGADDRGRTVVRAAPTSTTIPVGRSSQGTHDGELDVADNAYITVLNDFRVWAKISYIADDGTIYMDSDLAVSDRTTDPPPVANAGVPATGSIDRITGLFTTWFPHDGINTSFAVADGATITGYQWSLPAGVTLHSGSADTDALIQIDADPGFYWIALTVTDSNGKTHTARTWVLADDPDSTLFLDTWSTINLRRLRQGKTCTIQMVEPIPTTTYPDGTLVAVVDGEPISTTNRDNLVFGGWHQTDAADIQAGRTATLAGTTLECVDVAGRLDSLPGFSLAVYDDGQRDTEEFAAITWSYMVNATVDKLLHYLLQWQSTALDVADWTWSGMGSAFPFVKLECGGDTLFGQINRKAQAIMPDHYLCCDRWGRLSVTVDPLLQDAADRTTTTQANVTAASWLSLRWDWQRPPKTYWLQGSAILASSSTVVPIFARAPGLAPGQGGQEETHGEQLALSQTQLNAVTGHRYARRNAPLGQIQIGLVAAQFPQGSTIDPATQTWTTLTIPASVAAQRGLTMTTQRGLAHEINTRYTNTRTGVTTDMDMLWERETVGTPAVTYVPATAQPVDDGNDSWYVPPPTTPPDDLRSGVEDVALLTIEGYLFVTADFQTLSGSGGPTWVKTDLGTGALYSWVVDPFSPGYILGAGAVNGYAVGQDDIWRISDIFGTPAATSIHTFSDSAVVAAYHWRTIQASFGRYFDEGSNPWLLVVSYYGDTAGRTGTWATYSLNGGATWATETAVSAEYDTGLTAANPIGVYASPKTPGLGYTAAYYGTTTPAPADGYMTTDWGATWTRVSGAPVDDPAEPLLYWGWWDDTTGNLTIQQGGNFAIMLHEQAIGVQNSVSDNYYLLLAPHADAVRVKLRGHYADTNIHSGASYAFGGTLNVSNPTGTSMTEDLTFSLNNGQTFNVEWTRGAVADWPGDRADLTDPPTPGNFARFFTYIQAVSGSGSSAIHDLSLVFEIVEIELENGHIYTPPATGPGIIQPGQGQAGTLHFPWPSNDGEQVAYYGTLDRVANRALGLNRANGTAQTAVTPADMSRGYGVNRPHFAVRTYDNDRAYVAAAVLGNDASGDPANDYAEAVVSTDGGDTWTVIDGPTGIASAHPTEIAFGADDPDVLFVWGSDGFVGYSADGGTSIDSKAGNIATANGGSAPDLIIGIAGGQTG